MTMRRWLAVFSLVVMGMLTVEVTDAWARARGGGSRGSRSYSAPVRPAPTSPAAPASPGRVDPQPATPRPGPFGGFGGLLGGLVLGGLLGGLLFGHHGFGIGLLDVLLIGAGLMLLVSFLRRRPAERPAYAMAGAGGGDPGEPSTAAASVAVEMPAGAADLEAGIRHLRTMDPRFDPDALAAAARQAFLDVQRAVGEREVERLRDRLTPEMHAALRSQCDELRAAGRVNHVEGVDFRRSQVTEAWQESGRDFVTVSLAGTLVDYSTDGAGRVVEGSRTERQDFEEYWTFTRPVGPNPWRLSAIQPA